MRLFAAAVLLVRCSGDGAKPTQLRVAVLLPSSASDSALLRGTLDWAFASLNEAAGPVGDHLYPVYLDTASLEPGVVVNQAAPSAGVVAVIAGTPSAETHALAERLVAAEQVLISFNATSGELFRTFAGRRYFWRTVESDAVQARQLLSLAARGGARTAAFLTADDEYGDTFFDWLGFFAVEFRLGVTASLRLPSGADSSCADSVAAVLATSATPEVLIAAPSETAQAACILREAHARAPGLRVLFSDAAYPARQDLHALEGMEGTSPAADARSGFEAACSAQLQAPTPQFAANAYDAALLLAYGLARSRGAGGDALAQALVDIVNGDGEAVGWDLPGLRRGLQLARSGAVPRISGASGPLLFDRAYQTEPVTTTIAHWSVADGAVRLLEVETTEEVDRQAAAISTERQAKRREPDQFSVPAPPAVGTRTSLWALIVATSRGWENYRHQADALAQYQRLRQGGVPDDQIVLILADDLAANPANPEPGVVRAVAGGPDLYSGAHVDYRLAAMGADDLLRILVGDAGPGLPQVLSTDAGANLFVFLAGHGNSQGLRLNAEGEDGDGGTSTLSPEALKAALDALAREGRLRRALVAVDACQSGVFGEALDTPRVAVLTAGSAAETSRAYGWDASARVWRADEFAFHLRLAAEQPYRSITNTYLAVYRGVLGSHVQLFNVANWGDPDEVTLNEFVGAP